MNGTNAINNKPTFLIGKQLPQSYYEQPSPYKNAPSCNVNLLQLSRYAKKQGKALSQLTENEILMFQSVSTC